MPELTYTARFFVYSVQGVLPKNEETAVHLILKIWQILHLKISPNLKVVRNQVL